MRTSLLPALTCVAAVLSACGPSREARPPVAPPLPFIADDYAAALAEARARDLPLFIESWAPW